MGSLFQNGVPAFCSHHGSTLSSSASQETNTILPLTYGARAGEGAEQVCSPDELRQCLQAITNDDVSNLIRSNLPGVFPIL